MTRLDNQLLDQSFCLHPGSLPGPLFLFYPFSLFILTSLVKTKVPFMSFLHLTSLTTSLLGVKTLQLSLN